MAIKVQKKITKVICGLLPFWLIRSLAIYPEVSKSNMCNFIFFKPRVICLNNLLLPLPWNFFLTEEGCTFCLDIWDCPLSTKTSRKLCAACLGHSPSLPSFCFTVFKLQFTRFLSWGGNNVPPSSKFLTKKGHLGPKQIKNKNPKFFQNIAFEPMHKIILILSGKKKVSVKG